MRLTRSMTILAVAFAVLFVDAATENTAEEVSGESQIGQRGASPQPRGRRGRGRRPAIQTLNVSLSA